MSMINFRMSCANEGKAFMFSGVEMPEVSFFQVLLPAFRSGRLVQQSFRQVAKQDMAGMTGGFALGCDAGKAFGKPCPIGRGA